MFQTVYITGKQIPIKRTIMSEVISIADGHDEGGYEIDEQAGAVD